jgi:hypothetical protein
MEEERPSLEAKVSALLAIQVDRYLRETGLAQPRSRSIDRLLADAGLPRREIASLLGKTERAVNKLLASERSRRQRRKTSTRRSRSRRPSGG